MPPRPCGGKRGQRLRLHLVQTRRLQRGLDLHSRLLRPRNDAPCGVGVDPLMRQRHDFGPDEQPLKRLPRLNERRRRRIAEKTKVPLHAPGHGRRREVGGPDQQRPSAIAKAEQPGLRMKGRRARLERQQLRCVAQVEKPAKRRGIRGAEIVAHQQPEPPLPLQQLFQMREEQVDAGAHGESDGGADFLSLIHMRRQMREQRLRRSIQQRRLQRLRGAARGPRRCRHRLAGHRDMEVIRGFDEEDAGGPGTLLFGHGLHLGDAAEESLPLLLVRLPPAEDVTTRSEKQARALPHHQGRLIEQQNIGEPC